MKINEEKTKKYFADKVGEQYLVFLKKRSIISKPYLESLKSGQYGFLSDSFIAVDGYKYYIHYLLGPSQEAIYDLIGDNKIYGITPQEGTIFAILLGDDFLFFKPNDESVYLCYRETEEVSKIAENYNGFLNMISIQGDEA